MRPIDLTRLYLGVDNTQPNLVRIVCIDNEGLEDPMPIWHEKFLSLADLQRYLNGFLCSAMVAATTLVRKDPFDAFQWLRSQRVRLRRYCRHNIAPLQQDWEDYVPRPYRRAFGLARCAIYHQEAPHLLWNLFEQASDLESQVQGIAEQLEVLARLVYPPQSAGSRIYRVPAADQEQA